MQLERLCPDLGLAARAEALLQVLRQQCQRLFRGLRDAAPLAGHTSRQSRGLHDGRAAVEAKRVSTALSCGTSGTHSDRGRMTCHTTLHPVPAPDASGLACPSTIACTHAPGWFHPHRPER